MKALFISQLFGLIILSAFSFAFFAPFHLSASGVITGAVASLCNVIGMILLLKALSVGKVSVVAPLTSLYGAITTGLALLSGKAISVSVTVGLLTCILGACLAGISPSHDGEKESPGSVGCALMASVALGLGFWLQGEFAVKELGVVPSLWIYYATAFLLLAPVMIVRRDFSLPAAPELRLLLSLCILSLSGFFTLAYGASMGHVAVVTVLSSLASGVAALLGFILRNERLSPPQGAGIVIIIIGVIIIKL